MTDHEMICICGGEGMRAAEAARLEAQKRLGLRDQADLAFGVLLSLGGHFGAEVGVGVDQWFGVGARVGKEVDTVQCDHPLDGMVALWHVLAKRHPEKISGIEPYDNAAEVDAAEAPIAELAYLDDAYEAHTKQCATCAALKHNCPIARAALDRFCELRDQIIAKWGPPNFDAAPAYYGLDPPEVESSQEGSCSSSAT